MNADGVLHFYGVDSSVVPIARCHVLYQMMKNKCEARNILQVWFSTAWSQDTLNNFIKAIENLLLDEELDDEVKDVLKEWKESVEHSSPCEHNYESRWPR